jgi:oxygen-independent coproporphyrinogen-3 oxidase
MAGIYIHIPFCKQACHYCDFHFSTNLGRKDEMVSSICKEIEMRKEEVNMQTVETVYFGGGTPSILNTEDIQLILERIGFIHTISPDPEITLEANPDDISDQKLEELSVSGINRLSIGIQSFFDEDLRLLNRVHTAGEAEHCIGTAMEYFKNVSIDLIYGIPGLSDDRWGENINSALSFNVPHISSYALTVEPKTALHRFIAKGIVPDVDDSQAEAQFRILTDQLEREGFLHYEISNFGKPGFFSRNNTAYWQGKPYLGIGPSAHSFNGISRSWNCRNNAKYIKAIGSGIVPSEIEILTMADRYNEFVMTGLRTMWGLSLHRIRTEFGPEYLDYLVQESEKHIEQKLLIKEKDTLILTKKGKFLADGIASDLFMVKLD